MVQERKASRRIFLTRSFDAPSRVCVCVRGRVNVRRGVVQFLYAVQQMALNKNVSVQENCQWQGIFKHCLQDTFRYCFAELQCPRCLSIGKMKLCHIMYNEWHVQNECIVSALA
jgi:hypothetical protein